MNTPIAIYGGTLSPPTLAHASIVEQIITKTHIEKIIISPSGERDDKDFGICQEYRRELINLYIKILQGNGLNVELNDYFFNAENGGNTTSYEEGHYFKDLLGTNPWFVYGSDVIPDMPEWTGNINQYIEKELKKLFINREGHIHNPKDYGMENFIIADNISIDGISSTIARERIKVSESTRGILDPAMAELIQDLGLYGFDKK